MKRITDLLKEKREQIVELVRSGFGFKLRPKSGKGMSPKVKTLAAILLLAAPAAAQKLPFDAKDPSVQQTNEFLMQQIQKGSMQHRNNTFNGENTFKEDVTFESDVTIAGTLTLNSQLALSSTPTIKGTYVMVASHTLSAVDAATFTLTAGESYRLQWSYTKASAGHIRLRFNADDGNNYHWAIRGYVPGSGTTDNSTANTSQIYLYDGAGHSLGNNEYFSGSVSLEYKQGDNTAVLVYGGSHDSSGTNDYWSTAGGWYDGASDVTTVAMVASAGTFSGRVELLKYER